jgi:hypothetical protein
MACETIRQLKNTLKESGLFAANDFADRHADR